MEIWAKSDGTRLKKHTRDVLNKVKELWEETENRVKNRVKILEPDELKRMLLVAAFAHDFGKVWPRFQWDVGNKHYMEDLKKDKFRSIQHNLLSIFFLNKDKALKFVTTDEEKWNTVAPLLYSAIAFHHWRSDSINILLDSKSYIEKVVSKFRESLGKELQKMLEEEFKDFTYEGTDFSQFIEFDNNLATYISEGRNFLSSSLFFPPYSVFLLPQRLINRNEDRGIIWVFLAGFLMRADHFASWLEKEKKEEKIERKPPLVDLIEQLKHEKWWQGKEVESYKNKNVILIAPTGIGKTEFAFAWGNGDKFIFTLPLRVATNQIFERAENKNGEYEIKGFGEGNVGILHSDADIFLLERKENQDQEGEAFLVLELSRHLSLPVIIATGDQFFPSALRYPGYEKIYATLGYSRLIIDEVQAYDPRAVAIVVKLIRDITSIGGKFLLMTATLPGFIKESLNCLSFEEIDLFDGTKKVKFNFPKKHKVEIKKGDIKDSAGEIIEKAKNGKRVLVVANTVEKAQEVYEEILKEAESTKIEIVLLHSRFTFEGRKGKEEKAIKMLKTRPECELENNNRDNEGAIVVATQIVEASLDIDADFLYTEIAPADSLVQRMGRVLRGIRPVEGGNGKTFGEENYNQLYDGESNIKIFVNEITVKKNNKKQKVYESGKGKVYKNYLIERTREKLKDKDKGFLKENEKKKWVEEVYDKNFLEKNDYLDTFYQTISVLEVGYVSEKKSEAQRLFRDIRSVNVIPKRRIGDIIEELNELAKKTFTEFKRDFINKFVVPVNESTLRWKYKKEITQLEKHLDEKIPERLSRYIQGIYVVDLEYDDEKGLLPPEEKS